MADLTIIRGDDMTIGFTYTDADGDAIDITDYTIFFTAKPEVDDDATDAAAVISKDVTTHSDPTNGKTNITLTDSDTDVDLCTLKGEIQVVSDAGVIVSSNQFSVVVIGESTTSSITASTLPT